MVVRITEPYPHQMMPLATHDELARQNATLGIKLFMTYNVYPGDEVVFDKQAKPRFVREKGRTPKDKYEMRHLMMRQPYTQMWSAIARTLQEMLWYNMGECIERQLPELDRTAAQLHRKAKGTLRIDPQFKVPAYLSDVDIHAAPGSYGTDLSADDVFAGALYDRGAYYYSKGLSGPFNDNTGRALVEVCKAVFPNFKPKRILDFGCAVGASTLPWKTAFPDAEVSGIDVGSAMMRYAHARAEAFGHAVHFSQQSAEHTDFPDNYFDIVASSGVFHETSHSGSSNIMKEVYRILKPGGMSINSDIPHQHHNDLHDQFMLDWDCHYNAEPFWAQWTSMTSQELMSQAGFPPANVWEKWRDRDHQGGYSLHDRPKEGPHISNQGGIGKGVFWGAVKPA
ncbi:MAG: class I SAM-dependent methyltransferase [Alphaproteobacteria bacterium]|nr:class I SAM-dependent methyltransferase [Alphaproteobacteria bacterium]